MAKIIAEQPKSPPKVSVHVNVPKEVKMDVDFGGLKLKEQKSVTLQGTITSLNQDEYGKSFGMNVDSIGFEGSKPSSLKNDFEKIKKVRTLKGNEESDEED